MYITRQEAINVIYNVINEILPLVEDDFTQEDLEEYEGYLQEIASCIEHECKGLHTWGAEEEVMELFIAYREDLWTDELKQRLGAINEKHSFKPAPYEEKTLAEDDD